MTGAAVVIGRFQLFHNHHERIIDRALDRHEFTFIVVGSSNGSRTARTPFLASEVRRMIRLVYPRDPITFIEVGDYPGDNDRWAEEVQYRVEQCHDGPFTLVGNCKPGEEYLKILSDWRSDITHDQYPVSASDIRDWYFNYDDMKVAGHVPGPVYRYLKQFRQFPSYWDAFDAHIGCNEP